MLEFRWLVPPYPKVLKYQKFYETKEISYYWCRLVVSPQSNQSKREGEDQPCMSWTLWGLHDASSKSASRDVTSQQRIVSFPCQSICIQELYICEGATNNCLYTVAWALAGEASLERRRKMGNLLHKMAII